MPTTTFSMRIDEKLKKALEEQAALEDRSASYIAQRAIGEWVAREAAYKADIQAALKEAEKGIWISEEAMDRWVDSWGTGNELPAPEPDIFPEGYKPARKAA